MAREDVAFPRVRSLPFAEYLPPVWRMDFGAAYAETRVITREPPALGAPYRYSCRKWMPTATTSAASRCLKSRCRSARIRGGTSPSRSSPACEYLAGLVGSFVPFARTRPAPLDAGDVRPPIAERYANRQDYLSRVDRAAQALVRDRLMLAADLPRVQERAAAMWASIVGR